MVKYLRPCVLTFFCEIEGMDSSVKSITGNLLTFLFDCGKCNRFFLVIGPY